MLDDTEAEHFDRIQHVNQLAEEIENHRQIISKLREDIGKYVDCGLMSNAASSWIQLTCDWVTSDSNTAKTRLISSA
jgi:hypothetical protein